MRVASRLLSRMRGVSAPDSTLPTPALIELRSQQGFPCREEKHMTSRRIATAVLLLAPVLAAVVHADQPPAPCHPNPNANQDMAAVRKRGDIRHLPDPLEDRLVRMAGRPHSQLPTQAYAEAHLDHAPFTPVPSQLFQYYLLDTTGFEPNPFTRLIPSANDTAMLTATVPDCGLPTNGA